MSFPEIPEDLFDEFDWSKFNEAVVKEEIELVNSLSEEQLNVLGRMVDGYEASNERTRRVLQIVNAVLGIGLRFLLA